MPLSVGPRYHIEIFALVFQKYPFTAQIGPIFDNFSNPVKYLTWPDHGSNSTVGGIGEKIPTSTKTQSRLGLEAPGRARIQGLYQVGVLARMFHKFTPRREFI